MIYQAGTISIQKNSNIVYGLGTRWLTYVTPGDLLTINSETIEIASVDNINKLTLTDDYTGVNADLNSYYITITDNLYRLKIAKKKLILNAYRDQVAQITAQYEQSEIDTWTYQKDQAEAFAADNTSAVPFLSAQSAAREITVAEMAGLITAKSTIYQTVVAGILGKRQKLTKEINDAANMTELNLINW